MPARPGCGYMATASEVAYRWIYLAACDGLSIYGTTGNIEGLIFAQGVCVNEKLWQR